MQDTKHTSPVTGLRQHIKQHPERSQPERIHEILSLGYQAHVAYCEGDLPYVIPFSYHYDRSEPDIIYLHGSPKSSSLIYLAQGVRASVSVSLLDGLVYSRTALHHSMNYRSVVGFGVGEPVKSTAKKKEILEQMIDRYYPGRHPGHDYAPTPNAHIEQTLVVALKLDAVTAKIREGGANGPMDHKPFASGNAGVLSLSANTPEWRSESWIKSPFWISTDANHLPQDDLYAILKDRYWNVGLTPERLAKRVKNSLCFGLYHHSAETQRDQLIGFARLSHDGDSFGYLADVIVTEDWQKQGLGEWLMQAVKSHPIMKKLRWCLLATHDAQGFYAKQGFHEHEQPERMMVYRP